MNTMTLDEALRPTKMTCVKCGGEMTVYPVGQGIGYCPCSSPVWLKSFAEFQMNQERSKRGLEEIIAN